MNAGTTQKEPLNDFFSEDFSDPERVISGLKAFQAWLGINVTGKPVDFNKCQRDYVRLAPSIIARSDAIVLGASVPRFARRFFLDERRESFINLRRRKLLERVLPSKWAKVGCSSAEKHKLQEVSSDDSPSEFLRGGYVGDSVLAVPPRLLRQYDLVTTDLFPLYGEGDELPPGEVRHNVPFLRQYKLSGSCPDAALFMAACLLNTHAKKIFGLSELACIRYETSEHKTTDFFANSNANWPTIVRTAKEIGLNVIPQKCNRVEDISELAAINATFRTLSDYLRSGIPVLFPISLERLKPAIERNSRKENWLFESAPTPDFQGRPHSSEAHKLPAGSDSHLVVIIGVSAADSGKFLVLDSASVPFLEITQEELVDAAIPGDFGETGSPEIIFAPVLPSSVCMSLLTPLLIRDSLNDGATAFNNLYALSELRSVVRQNVGNSGGDEAFETTSSGSMGPTRLVYASELKDRLERIGLVLPQLSPRLDKSLEVEEFVWIQFLDETLLVWSTAPQGVSHYSPWDLLLGEIVIDNPNSFKISGFTKISRPNDSSKPQLTWDERITEKPRKMEPSLLSSFCGGGVDEAFKKVPKTCKAIELYCFMQDDVKKVLKQPEGSTVVDALHNIHDDDEAIQEVANHIHKATLGNFKIIGLASYIPEITSSNTIEREKAKNALFVLHQLAIYLRETHGHEFLNTVEIVAGNLIGEIGLCQPEGDWSEESRILAFSKQDEKQARSYFRECFDKLDAELRLSESDVCFALEVEPGPLYACKGLVQAKQFLEDLPQYACGLNLDIAHCSILGDCVSPEYFPSELNGRIVNVHVSDHGKGHFCDLVLGSQNDENFFGSWFDFLEDQSAFVDGAPASYAGNVSLEFELAPNYLDLERSFTILRDLLK